MAYRPHSRARVDPEDPRAFAVCQRCSKIYNSYSLNWQFQWMGYKLQNKRVQVCPECMDKASPFLRQIIIPPDPMSVNQPREEPYAIDEAGGYAGPVFFLTVGVALPITPPSWAKAFFVGCYGAGAAGSILNGSYPNMGGGGGAYAQRNIIPVSAGATVTIFNGRGGVSGGDGGDSWASITGVAPTTLAEGCLSKGGAAAFPAPGFLPTPGIGGQASACIGDVAYSGGNGGLAAVSGGVNFGGTGGGGAAGPAGNGLNGGDTVTGTSGSAGGWANGSHGVGTGGQPGRGDLTATALADSAGFPGGADPIYAYAGGPGGGGGGGGGGPNAANGGMGGAGGEFGGGGGGGGFGGGVNGRGGPGGNGYTILRWLQ